MSSSLSKTPDDKMHRYLQRIQKLVGHRAKSPILIKSRNKSPMNVKSSRLSAESKYQPFVKTFVSVYSKQWKHTLTIFFDNFTHIYELSEKKRRDSHFSEPSYNKFTMKKENDQPLAARFMVKALQRSTLDLLQHLFESIKAHETQKNPNQPQEMTRDIKKSIKHRRTYSEIYAESLSKYQSKSPATSQRYEFKTPQVAKKDSSSHLKKLQTRLIATLMQKIYQRSRQTAFSQMKSFYCASLSLDINEARNFVFQIEEKFTSLKNQQQKTVEQLKQANQTILDQQKVQQDTFFNLERIKEQSISKNQDDEDIQNSHFQTQKIFHKAKGVLLMDKFLSKKMMSFFACGFEKMRISKKKQHFDYAKCLALSNTLKNLWKSQKKGFFISLMQYCQVPKSRQKSQKSLFKTESKEIITQRVQTPPNYLPQFSARIQSMQSSKHSRSSQKSNTSNFDLIAKKINSAFEFKATLREVYSFGFQKIDEAAFIYMTISTPINKLIQTVSRQSFRKILFYSFFKTQQEKRISTQSKHTVEIRPLNDTNKMIENKPPIDRKSSALKILPIVAPQPKGIVTKNYDKMSTILKKVERKIIFMKIQAYSVLKLNCELKQPIKIPEDVVISQGDLKKQIKEFLNQRNKMHQKTYDTWNKTKEMLKQSTNSSSRQVLNPQIKT